MGSQQPYGGRSGAPPIYPSGPHGAPAMSGGPPVADHKRHHSPHPQAMPSQAPVAPPMYHASPNPPPGGRRIFHVYHQGWMHRSTQVMDSDKVTPVYTIESNRGGLLSSKPHMTILNAATRAVAGTVTFHAMSSSIDIEVCGRTVQFERSGVFSTAHHFQSPATGRLFRWKRDGVFSGGDLKCVDETEQVVANFESNNWAMQKDGKFEIAPLVNGAMFDEVLITGIAAMEYYRRQRRKGAAAGGASAGAVC